jgi:hypothetical protein
MSNSSRVYWWIIALSFFLLSTVVAAPLRAEDPIERAGSVLGTTAGNVLFVPLKTISVSMGLVSGALSFVVTGGNREITHQAWHNATQGPYLITPEVARRAIGERPELVEPEPVVLPK